MKTVVWSEWANNRVAQIAENVAEYAGVQSAVRYISEFNRLVDLAAYNPLMGKIGVVPNTRELYPINGKYRIVYRISGNELRVLTVKTSNQLHTAESTKNEIEYQDNSETE